ncbi:hypothetical protein P7266_0807 [Lactococcus cremoris]|nr:hypothetical protein P7266_0807 [Lactococcus cremoris]
MHVYLQDFLLTTLSVTLLFNEIKKSMLSITFLVIRFCCT